MSSLCISFFQGLDSEGVAIESVCLGFRSGYDGLQDNEDLTIDKYHDSISSRAKKRTAITCREFLLDLT